MPVGAIELDWPNLLVGAAFGIAATVASVWFTLRRTSYRLFYRTLTVSIVGASGAPESVGPEIEIRFAGRVVPRLVLTRVAVWNGGWKTLDASEVVEPLSLVVSNGAVLRSSVTAATRAPIRPSVRSSEQEAVCDFKFMDRNDGFMVELLHTGDDRRLEAKATIKGMPKGPESAGPLADRRPPTFRSAARPIAKALGILLPLVAVFSILVAALGEEPFVATALVVFGIPYGIFVGIGVLALVGEMGWLTARRVPKGLWAAHDA